jgi:hypothetical protein
MGVWPIDESCKIREDQHTRNNGEIRESRRMRAWEKECDRFN